MRSLGSFQRSIRALILCGIIVVYPARARADAFDIGWVLTRVGNWRESPYRAACLLVGMLLANYGLNVLVLGGVATDGGLSKFCAARELFVFTLVAQVADRLCAIIGFSLGMMFTWGAQGEAGLAWSFVAGMVCNFVLSGTTVGFLAYHYLRKRWRAPLQKSRRRSVVAAVVTNPAWVMVTWLGAGGYDATTERLHSIAVPQSSPIYLAERADCDHWMAGSEVVGTCRWAAAALAGQWPEKLEGLWPAPWPHWSGSDVK